MTTRIQLRRDIAANFTAENPVLASGELGVETDTGQFKFGDGTTVWASLDYAVVAVTAADVSVDSGTLVGAAADAQAEFELLDEAIVAAETVSSNHLADTGDAHDASAISVLDTATNFTGDDVEAVLAELAAAGGGGGGLAMYGDGSDGALTFSTGGATTAGATRSGTTYTTTRTIYASSITIDAGVTVLGLHHIFCTGTLTNNGIISHDGAAGVTTAKGVGALVPNAFMAGGTDGANGSASNTTTTAGQNGTAMPSSSMVGLGGTGGVGGRTNGGAGGVQLVTGTPGGSLKYLGPVYDLQTALTQVTLFQSADTLTYAGSWSRILGGTGGGGGGRLTGGTAASSGAGGGGGGCMVIVARVIDNTSGIIRCKGGDGGAAAGGTCVTGGGGGGGGGSLYLVYDSITAGTESVAGGAAGTGLNGADAAAAGGTGTLIRLVNA